MNTIANKPEESLPKISPFPPTRRSQTQVPVDGRVDPTPSRGGSRPLILSRSVALPPTAQAALGAWALSLLLLCGCNAAGNPSFESVNLSNTSEGTADERARSSAGKATMTPERAVPSASAGEVPDRADWPRFRGPTGMGTSEATGLPVAWSSEANVVWKAPLPGPGASSPIVFRDRVYVTCYTGYGIPGQTGGSLDDLNRHLIAIHSQTGKVLWDRAVPAKLPEEARIRDHGYAASTPVADDERVVVFFGKSGVFAFDHDGNRLWEASVGGKTSGWGTAASPVIYGDLLLVNASVESESLVALNRRTGKRVWKTGGINESWNTPLVITAASGRKELIVATHGSLKSFDPDSGSRLWTCDTDISWYMVPSVIAHDGVVYCLGGRSGTAALAVRAGGKGNVTSSHRLWTSEKGSNVSSPVYLDGHLYWVHDQRGVAYCARAATGEVVYEQKLDRAGQVYSSALLAEGRLYYLTRRGKTFVLAARPEFEQLAVNELRDGGQFNGSPVVNGKRLLIRSDKSLYCLEKGPSK